MTNPRCTDHSCHRRNSCKWYTAFITENETEIHPIRSYILENRDNAVIPDPDEPKPVVFACHAYQSRYFVMPVLQELLYEFRIKSFHNEPDRNL